ncbi:MAG: CHRD domain-containing protein [Acidobacteriota bacterium]|nr:CHRD domain-containing protein [Acidobacteriota bacterium]
MSSCNLRRALVVAWLGFLAAAFPARAEEFHTLLGGLEQVPPVLTDARGKVAIRVDPEARRVEFALEYNGLEGQPLNATIHFGQPTVNGTAIVVLCFTPIVVFPSETPRGVVPVVPVPSCPAETDARITGAFDHERVFAAVEQGVDFQDFDALVEVLRSGLAYVSVSSVRFPTGEIRGQIHPSMRNGGLSR